MQKISAQNYNNKKPAQKYKKLYIQQQKTFFQDGQLRSIDLTTWEQKNLGPAEGQGACVALDDSIFFLSGHLYTTSTMTWELLRPPPSPSFSLSSLSSAPVLLGLAHQNGTCSVEGCTGNTISGDTQVPRSGRPMVARILDLATSQYWQLPGPLNGGT